MTKEIILMRHGDNEVNDNYATHGIWQSSSELTELGITQVNGAKNALFDDSEEFRFCLGSPLKRAQQTAQIILPNASWITDNRLIARDLRLLDGIYKTNGPKTISDIEQLLPGFCFEVQERVLDLISETLRKLNDNEKAILVGHEPSLTLVLHKLCPDKFPHPDNGLLPKSGVVKIVFDNNNRFLTCEMVYTPN